MADAPKSPFIWFEVMTNDLDKAVTFYRNVAQWEVRDSGMPGAQYMLFGKDGKDVGGMVSWSAMGMTKPPKIVGHIYTPDVDVEVAAIVADGGKQQRPPQDIPGVGRFAVVTDPQGTEFLLFRPHLTEAPPRPAPGAPGSVGWSELATTDWPAAWEFYSKHFGWTKHMSVDMGPMGTYQTFMMDEVSGGGMMNLPPGVPSGPIWLFYFTVDDIQAAAGRVKDNGGTVTHGPAEVPGGAWILQGLDTQGCRFALTAAK